MNSTTLILVIALVASSALIAVHIINQRNQEDQRMKNAAFIAEQRAELKKQELLKAQKESEEAAAAEEFAKSQNEVKISSWLTKDGDKEDGDEIHDKDESKNEEETFVVQKRKNVIVDKLWSSEPSEDDVNVAENIFSVVKDSEDGDESMYSYKNLTHAHTLSRRETLPTRDAWTRADKMNPEQWESQVNFVREEIKASGQTLEQFRENTLTPLPEQLSALWDSADEPVKAAPASKLRAPPRKAASEAASLVRDAVQHVHLDNAELAAQSMIEIARAIKRSSALGVTLPSLPTQTGEAVKKWALSDNELVRSAALGLVNVVT